jgi:dTDP-glucose 4,6-dehydratase
MKKILVTGGLGFIGSHFIELALDKGYIVINYDKITYASNVDFLPDSKYYAFQKIAIEQMTALPSCDYIVHFAAESHVDRSINNSDPFINSNVMGTYRILELLKREKIENMQFGEPWTPPVLIYIGTDEVFGDTEEGFFKEDDNHNPSNPYSATKSCAEMLMKAWGRTYDLPCRITRTTNNYGERQHSEKLIPQCITSLANDRKVPIHGSGEYVRNWIYVKDNCNAIMKVMEEGKNGESYHISSNEEFSVLDIAEKICKKMNKDPCDYIQFISNRSGQDVRYALDNSKIKKELGWKQEYKFDQILNNIIESYLEKK